MKKVCRSVTFAGWILLAAALFIAGSLLGLFPKTLPATAVRNMIAAEKAKLSGDLPHDDKPSFSGKWRPPVSTRQCHE
ncbi:hypothetical protein PR048_019173 [Dryococelus australis]|uniref:Uncharacterized protein n=1 Tax=Dryococelus australis TaxID=614101 RepID=A0ABQ9H2V8_9NEOP|nr:hypothetical protein PR048_019173 [Dryococelus australis]